MSTAAGTARVRQRGSQVGRDRNSQLVTNVIWAAESVSTMCLWGSIFAVPLLMAGVRETGVAVFVACSLTMGVASAVLYFVNPPAVTSFSWAVPVCFAAIILVGLQLVPLPKPIVHGLSPFSSEFLTAWNAGHGSLPGSGYWKCISLTPSLTRSGFVLLIAYVTFFLTLLQRLKTLADIDDTIRLIAIASVVMATIGIGQLFFGNGDFLWMFHHPLRDTSWPAKGTFTNQNHFAHFLALGIGPLVWWWKGAGAGTGAIVRGRVANSGFGVARSTDGHQQAICAAIAVVIFAGVLSFSRGGAVSIFIASGISFAAMGRRWTNVLRLAVPALAFMAIGLFLFGTELFQAKWEAITQAESLQDLSRGRFLLWAALLSAMPSFWPAGAGVGSHAEVYQTWMKEDIGKRLSHAESGYLQVLIETGVPGLLLVIASIGLVSYWAFSSWKLSHGDQRMRVSILASGLLVSVVHSVMDFVWYIPACMILTLVLIACLCRTHQLYRDDSTFEGGIGKPAKWTTGWAMVVILFAMPVGRLAASVTLQDAGSESTWMAYRGMSVAAGKTRTYESLKKYDEQLDPMIALLEECIRQSPADFRAMSDLSSLYLRRFERNQQGADNPMSVQEIRSTVESAGFESSKEILSWLNRAFGDKVIDLYRAHVMASRAVLGQPLRGQNYLILAQLGFLNQLPHAETKPLIEQAVRLRPYNPAVLYCAGLSQAEDGDLDKACELWRQAFHLSKEIQPLIIRSLISHFSAEQIDSAIRPEANGLWLMFSDYEAKDLTDRQLWVAQRYAQQLSNFMTQAHPRDVGFWVKSYDILSFLGRDQQAVACLGLAVEKFPTDFKLRKRHAFALIAIGQTEPAMKELEWCRLRSPDDQQITDVITSIARNVPMESPL